MNPHYQHRQTGFLMIAALGLGAIAAAALGFRSEASVGPLVVASVLMVVLILFGSLTVSVSETMLRIHFGPGLIQKNFPISEIQSWKMVRNPWYYGWGIRLTPHGWLFNVSGFDAVEIALQNGKTYRIGTDEPEKLEKAIRDGVGRAR